MDSVSKHDAVPMSSTHSHSVDSIDLSTFRITPRTIMSASSSMNNSTEIVDLNNKDKLELLLDFDSFTHSSVKLEELLNNDVTHKQYLLYAPKVMTEITKLIKMHEVSEFSFESGVETLMWLTTSVKELKTMIDDKSNGSDVLYGKYLFPSSTQALMHNLMHEYFELSELTVSSDTIALCVTMPTAWLQQHSKMCRNGYCISYATTQLKLTSFVPKGSVLFAGDVMMALMKTNSWLLNVTHSHVSHFECVLDVQLLDHHHMGAMEIVESIMSGEQGKLSATVERHAPSYYNTLLRAKQSVQSVQSDGTPSSSQILNVGLDQLEAGDSMTVTLKKAKKM
eukprot:5146920-Amphidinium_carterae.1